MKRNFSENASVEKLKLLRLWFYRPTGQIEIKVLYAVETVRNCKLFTINKLEATLALDS